MIELLLEAERDLSFGLLDQAERLYRQVAINDPKSSIAVMGLARVALERGDEREAYLLARRALAIDADNPAAQHMVSRLTEVMATRGETPPGGEEAVAPPAPPSAEVAAPAPPRPTAAKRPGVIGRLLGRRRQR